MKYLTDERPKPTYGVSLVERVFPILRRLEILREFQIRKSIQLDPWPEKEKQEPPSLTEP